MVFHEVLSLGTSFPCVIPVMCWYLVGFCCVLMCCGGIGLVSSSIMCGTFWDGCLGTLPGWIVISPCGSTLGGGSGATSGVVSRVFTLGGGVTCGGSALLNIYASFRSAAVCLFPNVVSGLVGVGLRRA